MIHPPTWAEYQFSIESSSWIEDTEKSKNKLYQHQQLVKIWFDEKYSSNKNLINIVKKAVASHHKDWHTHLYNALWEYRITPKVAIGNSPYYLVYGKESILPSNLIIPSLELAQYIQ